MYKHKRLIVSVLICVIVLLQIGFGFSFASAKNGSDESQSGQIEVILNVDDKLMKKYIEAFNQKYPDIKVKYTKYSDYESDIMKRINSGDYGDVLFIPASLDLEGVQNYLEPLGNLEDFTDKYNFIENAYIINNKVYSIPSSAYLKGILYNREVFDKAGISRTPRTQEQFIKALSMIKERTEAVPFYTNYDIDWVLSDWSFFPYIEMSGDAKYRSEKFIYEKNPFLKGSNYYKSYKLLYDIVNKGLCEDASSSFDFGQICTKVNNGEIAAVVAGTWAYQQMKYAGNNHDAVAFMPFPNEIDGRQYSTIGVDYGYSISKNSKNKELARKFIDFMIDESGYAIDNDRISIVKSDPLPDVYSKINNLELKISDSLNDRSYYYLNKLTEKRNPESVESIREVIDEARKSDGDYDLLMKSWNDTWEESRSAGMKTYRYEELQNETEFSDDTSNGTPETLIMDNSDVEYSKTEKEYIRAAKKIKVGYLTNMAPFQYEEKNGREFVGLAKVICESVKTSTKMKFQYVPFTNSNDLVNALYSGQIAWQQGLRERKKEQGIYYFLNHILSLPMQ